MKLKKICAIVFSIMVFSAASFVPQTAFADDAVDFVAETQFNFIAYTPSWQFQ